MKTGIFLVRNTYLHNQPIQDLRGSQDQMINLPSFIYPVLGGIFNWSWPVRLDIKLVIWRQNLSLSWLQVTVNTMAIKKQNKTFQGVRGTLREVSCPSLRGQGEVNHAREPFKLLQRGWHLRDPEVTQWKVQEDALQGERERESARSLQYKWSQNQSSHKVIGHIF